MQLPRLIHCRHPRSPGRPVVRWVVAALSVWLWATAGTAPGGAEEIAAELFDYSPGELHGQEGGAGWGGPWIAQAGLTEVVDSSEEPLEFAVPGGGTVSDADRALELVGNHDNIIHRPLAEPFSGEELFVSFLFRFEGSVNDNDFLGLWLDDAAVGTHTTVPSIGMKANGGGGRAEDLFVRPRQDGEAYARDILPGETYLIVGRLTKSVANNPAATFTRFELWVNPAYEDFSEDSSDPDAVATGGTLASFQRIGLRVPTFSPDDRALVAQLRLGDDWDDVVPPASSSAPEFIRGDVNADGALNLTDPVFALNHLFLGGDPPACDDAADADDDGAVTITDSIFSLNGLFLGGPQPPPPGGAACGPDPTADGLGCADFAACSGA